MRLGSTRALGKGSSLPEVLDLCILGLPRSLRSLDSKTGLVSKACRAGLCTVSAQGDGLRTSPAFRV